MSGPKRSSEALWWVVFSVGGVLAALFVPAFVLVTGFALPSGDVERGAAALASALGWWPVEFALFGIVALSLFHCAHRIRHTLIDLGMRRYSGLLRLPCYGGAAALSAWTGWVLLGT